MWKQDIKTGLKRKHKVGFDPLTVRYYWICDECQGLFYCSAESVMSCKEIEDFSDLEAEVGLAGTCICNECYGEKYNDLEAWLISHPECEEIKREE